MNHKLLVIISLSVIAVTCIVLVADASEAADDAANWPSDPICGIEYNKIDDSSVEVYRIDETNYIKWCEESQPEHPEVLTIPDTVAIDGVTYEVSGISEIAICNLSTVVEVVVGDNVEYIEAYNFNTMPLLTTVTFGDSVATVGYCIFEDCPLLTTLNSESSSLYIDGYGGLYETKTYSLIRLLETTSGKYTVISTASHIGRSACANCGQLTEVVFFPALISIGPYSFSNCYSLEHVTYSASSTEEIKDTFPDNILYIGENAFDGCLKLNNVKLNDDLTIISTEAFENCTSITSVEIPYNVSYIGEAVFAGCTSLQSITISQANDKYSTRDGILYEKMLGNNYATLMIFPMGKELTDGRFEVPSDVDNIAYKAFSGAVYLKELVLSNEISYLDAGALEGCTNLVTVNIPETITVLNANLFMECTSLKNVNIQSQLIRIEYGVFSNCTSLESITLPESVKYIGMNAFSGCSSLTHITIPASVETVDQAAFAICGLTHIRVNGEKTTFGEQSLLVSSSKCTLIVECSENLVIPDTAFNVNPEDPVVTVEYDYFDKVPYPYENWIAIAFCVALMVFIAIKLRRV